MPANGGLPSESPPPSKGRRPESGFPLGVSVAILTAAALAFLASAASAAPALKFMGLEEALAKSKTEGKFTVLYFWTKTCPYCRYLDQEVLTDPEVVADLNRDFVMVSLDKDREKRLSSRFRVFINSEGEPAAILPGAAEPLLFRLFLGFVATNSYLTMDFEEFIDHVAEN